MANISAHAATATFGGLADNLNLTADHWAFAWVDQWAPSPYCSDTTRLAAPALTAEFPVSAAGRAIAVHASRSYVDDYYHRIHIAPARLDLGNVSSTQTTEVFLWNAYFQAHSLSSIDVPETGIEIAGQSTPLLFAPLQERIWQLSVTPDGSPVLDTELSWIFDNGEIASLPLTATRIIAWAFAPNWAAGVLERLSWLTDILQSESAAEQRRALRLEPRREFEASMYVEGRERQLLDLALFGWGAKVWAMPLWHEIQLLGAALPAQSLTIACATEHLDFHSGGLAMLRGESALVSETVEISAVESSGLTLKRATQRAWPAGTRLYPVRSAMLAEQPSLTRHHDRLISCDLRFHLVESSGWTAALPETQYRGWPVWEQTPEQSDDLTHAFTRLTSTLDNDLAIPLVTDTAGRALPTLGYAWQELGRAEAARLRSLLYALCGRRGAIWIPTHCHDLSLLETISATATTLDIANVGYSRFANAAPGRRDIMLELYDGSRFYRRITGCTELSDEVERLAIDEALGQSIEPAQLRCISYLHLCRLDSDTQEIEHKTDSQGVTAWATVFVGVRDDEF
jgi:hypothetical protein